MKDIHIISLALSIAVHLCIVVLFVGLTMGSRKLDKIVVVDLTFMAGQEMAGTGSPGTRSKAKGNGALKRATDAPRTKPEPHDKTATGDPQRSLIVGKTDRVSEVSTQISTTLANLPGDTMIHQEQSGQGWKEGGGSARTTGTGGGMDDKGSGAGSGTGGTGSGSPGGGINQGGSDYYYIRETVMKNIKYPERARKMGQEGRVVLSFIVLENGATSEVKVTSSCGYRLLDESAKEGVTNTTIHKKVPYKVMVTLPITYRLQ